jgi:hypothetical protein
MKYYLNVAKGFIDRFNGVSGVIGEEETMNFEGLDWVELNDTQIGRMQNSKDITYIITGVVPQIDLETQKGVKRGILQSNYDNKLSLGFTSLVNIFENEEVSQIEMTLRLEELAQVEFTKMKSHLSGITTGLYPIWDYQSIKYKMYAIDYYNLLIAYGNYLVGLKESFNDKSALIFIAEDETTLNGINLEF